QFDNTNNFVWLAGEEKQQTFLKAAATSTVTLSMIGNDIGFSNKIQRCILAPDPCFHFREDRQSIASEINGKFDTLANMYQDIKTTSQNAKVYVLGYPQLFSTNTQCKPNVLLDPEERQMSRGLVTY